MSGMAELAGRSGSDGEVSAGSGSPPGILVLLRNEALKARHRLAFWTGLLVFLLIVFIVTYAPFYQALTGEGGFGLPDAWPQATVELATLAGIFGATVLILLIGSEWTWKTARQNVIDGLSREQWFLGKVLLWVALTAVFLVAQLALVGGMAASVTTPGSGPLIRVTDLWMMAGAGLVILARLGMGFLAAFLVRGTGSAVGLFFIWLFLERFVSAGLRGHWDWLDTVADHLPQEIIVRLGQAGQYDPVVREARAERLAALGRQVPEVMSTPLLVGQLLLWMAVFVALSWLAFRRRDL